jgi:phosphomannomutase
MIPWLLIAELLRSKGESLSALVQARIRRYPASGEINRTVPDVAAVLREVARQHAAGEIDWTDGLSVEYPEWRFNLRGSNTEPVIRLNVESRGDEALMRKKTEELLASIARLQ